MQTIERVRRLRQRLVKESLGAMWIENPIDLSYLTGLSLSKGLLWVARERAILFVDGRYLAMAREKTPCAVEPEETLPGWLTAQGAQRVGFDSSWTSYDAALKLQRLSPGIEFIPLPRLLERERAIKDHEEMSRLQAAARLTQAGIQAVSALLQEGVTEQDIALEFELFCRKHGASGLSFESIVAFGANGAFPHHRAGSQILQSNQMVLLDMGAVVDGYHGDLTRMVHVGTPPREILRLEEIVRRAHEAAVAHVAPGVRVGDLDLLVRRIFAQEGVEALFTHGLGHGVGLETHEFPRLKSKGEDRDVELQPGMVITIEPGLYQVGLGGIRIEDMVFVTESGYTLLA